jgi:hypothetical protein
MFLRRTYPNSLGLIWPLPSPMNYLITGLVIWSP